jgi:hypothetical protein
MNHLNRNARSGFTRFSEELAFHPLCLLLLLVRTKIKVKAKIKVKVKVKVE